MHIDKQYQTRAETVLMWHTTEGVVGSVVIPSGNAAEKVKAHLVGGHVTDGAMCLDGLQLVQTPVQLLQGLPSQLLVCLVCITETQE